MIICWLDTEVFNELDVRRVGSYRYAEHPSCEVLMCAYAIGDEPVRVAVGALEIMEQVEPLFERDDLIFAAMNSGFDRVVFSRHLGMPVGTYLDPARWLDPSVLASCAGYPGGLGNLTKALKVTQKDTAGTRLINLFCKPNRKGERNGPDTHPEEWARFVAYCATDVESMRDAARRLPKQIPAERAVWIADQRINDRGIRLDMDLARAAVAANAENKTEQRARVIELTGVANPGSVQQLLAWFASTGLDLPNLTKETVAGLLKVADLTPAQREVLQLRQELALASAPGKFKAAVTRTNADGRYRGAVRYHGAHTGRWTGGGIQTQNLPRASLGALEPLALQDLLAGFGASPQALKALVRPLILGPLTIVDYSQIEARVTAWLAGEQWVLDAFAAGQDIYVETARRMGMVSNKHASGYDRQSGKSATLGLGFGGGPNALFNVGYQGSEDQADELVQRWRKANGNTVRFWNKLWSAFQHGGRVAGITVYTGKGTRRMELPSGRSIVYRGVRKAKYEGEWKTVFSHPTGKTSFLWRGSPVENAVQGIARDLMARALPVLEDAGVPVVMHVHDEIVAEGNHLEKVSAAMLDAPGWAAGLPIGVDGHVVQRYTK